MDGMYCIAMPHAPTCYAFHFSRPPAMPDDAIVGFVSDKKQTPLVSDRGCFLL